MESPNLNLTLGRIDCSDPVNLKMYVDTQNPSTCHVCLSTGAVVGLSFHAQTGLISLAALLILLFIIARNYTRNLRKPPPGQWRLLRGNVDILMLNLIMADMLMSFGAISDIRWAYDRQVYCGSFCNAQGVIQTMGETAAALSTLYVRRFVIIWLWCLLWPVILLRKYDEPGPGENGAVKYAFTPTPWWCWINDSYLPERIVAEYLWLWIAGIASIGLYVPAYFIIRNQQERVNRTRRNNRAADERSIASTIDEGDEAVKLLWYPLAYTLCVLPLSIIRWATFANHDLLSRSQIMPASMTFSSIFNLMGLINVLLIYWTRPAILLIGSDGTLQPTDPRYSLSKDNVDTALNHLSTQRPSTGRRQDSDSANWRRTGNGFNGVNLTQPREV
ncbi:unnamed protein product [Rhizoctonia solani]|uniref:G-protein coupled receptors family 1 profile domain-containing protein n=1 Tax=Rhizoctonia solani TaxID=456999 RepID=A0A8H3GEN4_9AGAM|nr:unnamed protein product [Rhizoctonia solani]